MPIYVILAFLIVLFSDHPASAREMQLTIYDDGYSCPANCDAHVVFAPSDNGTRYAFHPNSTRTQPEPCVRGETCVICFGESDKSCMSVMYRGHGPEAGRFDFTPTFYSANCPRADIPSALEKECRALDSAARSKGYADALNCFETPTDAKCTAVMAQAKVVKDADIPKRDRCLKVGEDHYNDEQTDPKERRSDDCNYSEQSLGNMGNTGSSCCRRRAETARMSISSGSTAARPTFVSPHTPIPSAAPSTQKDKR
jgi:hypothetical protein